MDGVGKHAEFYRAYLPHDRSLVPVAVALCAIVALWLSLDLIGTRVAEGSPNHGLLDEATEKGDDLSAFCQC